MLHKQCFLYYVAILLISSSLSDIKHTIQENDPRFDQLSHTKVPAKKNTKYLCIFYSKHIVYYFYPLQMRLKTCSSIYLNLNLNVGLNSDLNFF